MHQNAGTVHTGVTSCSDGRGTELQYKKYCMLHDTIRAAAAEREVVVRNIQVCLTPMGKNSGNPYRLS